MVENDLAALENAHRSHLLTRDGAYPKNSARLRDLFLQQSKDPSDVLGDSRTREMYPKKYVISFLID
jgi:hypothetical protein